LLAVFIISGCQSRNPYGAKPVHPETDGDPEWHLAMVTSDYAWHMSEAQGERF
jgi:hypothetical protein